MPRHQGDVGDLLEGLAAGLARLELDEVEQLDLTLEDEVVVAQQDALAHVHRGARPGPLRRARASTATATSSGVDSGSDASGAPPAGCVSAGAPDVVSTPPAR